LRLFSTFWFFSSFYIPRPAGTPFQGGISALTIVPLKGLPLGWGNLRLVIILLFCFHIALLTVAGDFLLLD